MSIPVQTRLVKTPIDATDEVVYTVPSSTDVLITQVMLCNTSASTVTVSLALTDSAATTSAATDRFFSEFSISANETVMVMTSLPISNGEKIWASASDDDVVNLIISGVVTTTV
jgi:hypothetical protein